MDLYRIISENNLWVSLRENVFRPERSRISSGLSDVRGQAEGPLQGHRGYPGRR